MYHTVMFENMPKTPIHIPPYLWTDFKDLPLLMTIGKTRHFLPHMVLCTGMQETGMQKIPATELEVYGAFSNSNVFDLDTCTLCDI